MKYTTSKLVIATAVFASASLAVPAFAQDGKVETPEQNYVEPSDRQAQNQQEAAEEALRHQQAAEEAAKQQAAEAAAQQQAAEAAAQQQAAEQQKAAEAAAQQQAAEAAAQQQAAEAAAQQQAAEQQKAAEAAAQQQEATPQQATEEAPRRQRREANQDQQQQEGTQQLQQAPEQQAEDGDRRRRGDDDQQRARRGDDDRRGDDSQRARRGGDDRDFDRRAGRRRNDDGNLVVDLGIPGISGRVIINEDGDVRVRADDDRRFGRDRNDRRTVDLPNGRTRTVVERPNGVRIITVRDRRGNIIRRVREAPNGRTVVLIDQERFGERRRPVRRDPIRLTIPQDEYIVDSRRANRRVISQTLQAPPVVEIERDYSLEEIRNEPTVRATLRRVDLSTITFETGSATISRSQIDALDGIGFAMSEIIKENPEEIFLIEGHTDAVGDNVSNLALSDARAESVAIALSEYYDVPPENIVTQGYGESDLKIETERAERQNRRVAVRRITPLMQQSSR
ncbi:OmpA family protein [Tepidamorphus sp. 3E244]|uniref:OmpA family protein n=1 Tax=Tepidamorphus sp. 3E244 TaxID=3385498 RepID=UPI0038FD3138